MVERTKNSLSGTIAQKLVCSGLLEAVVFLSTMECPELIIECANHYDPHSRCTKKVSGEVLAIFNGVTIMSPLKIPQKETYKPYNFEEVGHLYRKYKKNYNSVVVQSWLLKKALGGSRFSKPLTIMNFIKNFFIQYSSK